MIDDELEQTMRAGLERRALRADVDVAVVDRARRAARGRRTRSLAVVAVAAVAVVAVAVTGVVVARDDRGTATGPATSTPSVDSSGALRTEYWRGVQVDVPATWGWGGTPDACGALPVGEPYVGRPIIYTDACSVVDPDATPTAPYVWFDQVDVQPGIDDLGDGYTRETVEVNDSAVSVATADPDLRARIIGSVVAGEVCGPELSGTPAPRYDETAEGTGPFVSARLCAYRDGGLVYGQSIGRSAFDATIDAVERAPRSTLDRDCVPDEVVVVSAFFESPDGVLNLNRDVVYDLTCGEVGTGSPGGGAPRYSRITEPTVPWAGEQFRRLLTGPRGASWADDRFIGRQG